MIQLFWAYTQVVGLGYVIWSLNWAGGSASKKVYSLGWPFVLAVGWGTSVHLHTAVILQGLCFSSGLFYRWWGSVCLCVCGERERQRDWEKWSGVVGSKKVGEREKPVSRRESLQGRNYKYFAVVFNNLAFCHIQLEGTSHHFCHAQLEASH